MRVMFVLISNINCVIATLCCVLCVVCECADWSVFKYVLVRCLQAAASAKPLLPRDKPSSVQMHMSGNSHGDICMLQQREYSGFVAV